MDWISKMQTLFTCLITLQFVVVTSHDLVDIPGWTHGSQVQSIVGRRKLWLMTLVNAIFPGLAVAFAIYFWNKPRPGFVADYWIVYCAVALGSAIAMWYVPYLLGTTVERKRDCARMYAGTRQVLPPRGDNPRPNLLHVCFHALFVINLFLALVLRFRST
jgi:hypothetical protein